MGVQVIPIPIEVVSHSLPFPFPILCFIPIPMGFPWDSRSHWESHSHAHLYAEDNDMWCSCKPIHSVSDGWSNEGDEQHRSSNLLRPAWTAKHLSLLTHSVTSSASSSSKLGLFQPTWPISQQHLFYRQVSRTNWDKPVSELTPLVMIFSANSVRLNILCIICYRQRESIVTCEIVVIPMNSRSIVLTCIKSLLWFNQCICTFDSFLHLWVVF